MKIRHGFVSNSSSCSFVCPICGYTQSGWDWDDPPVCDRCEGKIVCPDCGKVIDKDEIKNLAKMKVVYD